MKNPLFNYIKNQYILGKFSDGELITLVALGRITEEDKKSILETPQINR